MMHSLNRARSPSVCHNIVQRHYRLCIPQNITLTCYMYSFLLIGQEEQEVASTPVLQRIGGKSCGNSGSGHSVKALGIQ